MRIGGLASGMDIDKIVSDLMKAERIPLDKMEQEKQLLEWKRDDYRDMNKLLTDLDSFIFDGIYRQSTFLSKSVSSSNEDAVSATAGTAVNTSTRINVTQLATAAMYNSTNAVTDSNGDVVSGDTLLKDVAFNGGQAFTTGFSLKLSFIKPGESQASAITIPVDPSADSIKDVMAKINSHTDLGVSAFYDSATNKVVLTMKDTGDGASVSITDDGSGDTSTADFFSALGFSNVSAGSELSGKTAGLNAEFEYNGFATSRTSNTFEINDVSYTLKEVTNGDVSLSVTQNTDSIFDSIVKFVDKYNQTIEKINGELTEDRYRDFPPLTDKQREDLSENEIELWEEKAMSGMLRRDSILTSGLYSMRVNLYTPVSGATVSADFDQLSEIGIQTLNDYTERGKLVINENKLREAIDKDPNAIYELFMSEGTAQSDQGIARRLRDSISETMEKIEAKAGNSLLTNEQFTMGRNLEDIEDEISTFERRLLDIEDRYWGQFTTMEKAISRMNQQSAYLMQQFGG
ncbi:flagellar hook-associated protein 2 [Pseudalkalibacillus decolorationis]|uniref:flagellar hook-associated protein 2 n=1 Tax=Pseudalkalibacillus decolorationis TaxID=163879 RepID=UPI00214965E2|nr:flagellar hook-associated protein 2 [Pseudalkalibacillus decolorationis]